MKDNAKLKEIACDLRKEVIKMLESTGSGHAAGSLGMADIFACLYFSILHHDPENPHWEDRDRLLLSNGHIAPLLYAALSYAGYFPQEKLKSLRKFGSFLQGHPERERLRGVEITSGPLGSGLAQACGIAAVAKREGRRFRVFCVTSDGEHQEGNHWEAVLFAAKYKLGNLTAFVDSNNIQISGKTSDVMPLEPLLGKYQAFSWNALVIDGHDISQILNSVKQARLVYDKPTVIIAKTTPGKGVSFMEDNYLWHGKAPNKNEAKAALRELEEVCRDVK